MDSTIASIRRRFTLVRFLTWRPWRGKLFKAAFPWPFLISTAGMFGTELGWLSTRGTPKENPCALCLPP
uniref:Uncharacterized protein n=1 Tax=Rhizophora mucronata TaxID=61149 RepID=A0A2P2PKG4_RHIMU